MGADVPNKKIWKDKYGAWWNNTEMGIQTHVENPHEYHFDHSQFRICLAIASRPSLCEFGENPPNVCCAF
jgi:hypothetical protein